MIIVNINNFPEWKAWRKRRGLSASRRVWMRQLEIVKAYTEGL